MSNRFVRAAIVAFATTGLLIFTVPRTLKDIHEARLLTERGQVAEGQVISHERVATGKEGCGIVATVRFQTRDGLTRLARVAGCGALPGNLPLGRLVDVRYLPGQPAVYEVRAAGTLEPRDGGLSGLLMMLALAGVLYWAAFQETRKPP